jgi:hypothetical protein
MEVTHAFGSGRSLDKVCWGPKYPEARGSDPASYLSLKLIARVPCTKGLSSGGEDVRESTNGGKMSGMARTRRRVDRATTGALAGGPAKGLVGAPAETLVVPALLTLVLTASFTILLPRVEADSGAVREG